MTLHRMMTLHRHEGVGLRLDLGDAGDRLVGGLGLKVLGLGIRSLGLGFRVWGLGFRF